MRTLVITNPVPLHNVSPLVSLGKFVRVLVSAGYSPLIIGARLPNDGIPEIPDGVRVKSLPYGGRGIFKLFSYIFLQLRLFFSLLIKLGRDDTLYFWIADKMIGAFLAARLRGAEINFFVYGNVAPHGGISERLTLYMASHASRICAEAPSVFDQWDLPASVPRCCIKLFVPSSGIAPVPFSERPALVGMMCRLAHGKHADDAVRAFCRLHERLPEFGLRIIGGGPLEAQTLELIDELGAGEYISVTGWLEHDDALRELSRCRVLLYPTDAEGVPGGILEAMFLGVIPLATPVGGIPDVIDDGVNGFFLSDTSPDTIAAQLSAVLTSESAQGAAAASIQKIEKEFSLAAAARNLRAVCGDSRK